LEKERPNEMEMATEENPEREKKTSFIKIIKFFLWKVI
jgi:hypothetical protein